jgi:hypothetical protein
MARNKSEKKLATIRIGNLTRKTIVLDSLGVSIEPMTQVAITDYDDWHDVVHQPQVVHLLRLNKLTIHVNDGVLDGWRYGARKTSRLSRIAEEAGIGPVSHAEFKRSLDLETLT